MEVWCPTRSFQQWWEGEEGGWHFCYLIFWSLSFFTFWNYFTLCKIVWYVWRRFFFFSANIILWKKVILSYLKMEYLKTGWNRKKGSGNKYFKEGGASWVKGGCLKTGGWNTLSNYESRIFKIFYMLLCHHWRYKVIGKFVEKFPLFQIRTILCKFIHLCFSK